MHEEIFLSGAVRKQRLPKCEPSQSGGLPALKRLMLEQGELAQLHNGGEPLKYLACLELKAGATRGNHFHKTKRELLYVIAGRLVLVVQDTASGELAKLLLESGDLAFIDKGIAHALQPLEAGFAVEFSP